MPHTISLQRHRCSITCAMNRSLIPSTASPEAPKDVWKPLPALYPAMLPSMALPRYTTRKVLLPITLSMPCPILYSDSMLICEQQKKLLRTVGTCIVVLGVKITHKLMSHSGLAYRGRKSMQYRLCCDSLVQCTQTHESTCWVAN